ncbi:MAG: hypothetical protein H6625_01115 [Bdellovibrionaceae bacterium]|nr:hypothetical protein [Pseudobdellovibrionaceae bacterium]
MSDSIKIVGLSLSFIFCTVPIAAFAISNKAEINKEISLLERKILKPKKIFKPRKHVTTNRPYKVKKKLPRKSKNLPQKVVLVQSESIASPVIIRESPVTTYSIVEPSSRKPLGISIFTFYSMADHLKTTSNSVYSNYSTASNSRYLVDYTGEYSSNPSFGIGLEYSRKSLFEWSRVGFGFSGGVTYDFNRTIKREYIQSNNVALTGTNINNNYVYEDPELAIIMPYININININDAYIFSGVNYSVPQESKANDENFEGKMGFQMGIGMQVSSYIALEVSHRWLSFDVNPIFTANDYYVSGLDTYRLNTSGLGVSEKETLDLNGFNLAIKATF